MGKQIYEEIAIFSGKAGKPLARRVCEEYSEISGDAIQLSKVRNDCFADGECRSQPMESMHGQDVYIINSTCQPDRNFIDTAFLANSAQGASAGRVTVVLSYFGYGRADHKDERWKPKGAKIMAELVSQDADRVIVLDLHNDSVENLFLAKAVDVLYSSKFAIPYLIDNIVNRSMREVIFASTDAGGGKRARAYAKRAGVGCVIFDKERSEPNMIEEDSVVIAGNVEGKDIVFIDDMIDSGGTIFDDAIAAKEAGAKDIYVYATHAVFSRKVLRRIDEGSIRRVIVTDSIHRTPRQLQTRKNKIVVISCARLLAEAIFLNHDEESLSESDLFLNGKPLEPLEP